MILIDSLRRMRVRNILIMHGNHLNICIFSCFDIQIVYLYILVSSLYLPFSVSSLFKMRLPGKKPEELTCRQVSCYSYSNSINQRGKISACMVGITRMRRTRVGSVSKPMRQKHRRVGSPWVFAKRMPSCMNAVPYAGLYSKQPSNLTGDRPLTHL